MLTRFHQAVPTSAGAIVPLRKPTVVPPRATAKRES
jgi:hypothetical protein